MLLKAAQERVMRQHELIEALRDENRELREDKQKLLAENADLKCFLRAALTDLGVIPKEKKEENPE